MGDSSTFLGIDFFLEDFGELFFSDDFLGESIQAIDFPPTSEVSGLSSSKFPKSTHPCSSNCSECFLQYGESSVCFLEH